MLVRTESLLVNLFSFVLFFGQRIPRLQSYFLISSFQLQITAIIISTPNRTVRSRLPGKKLPMKRFLTVIWLIIGFLLNQYKQSKIKWKPHAKNMYAGNKTDYFVPISCYQANIPIWQWKESSICKINEIDLFFIFYHALNPSRLLIAV